MNKINIFITFAFAILFSACATYSPQYLNNSYNGSDISFSSKVDKTFYLLGNAGNKGKNEAIGLKAFSNFIADKETTKDVVLFLGNSFKAEDEKNNDEILKSIEGFKGSVVAIPADLEWNKGVDGLEKIEDYLKSKFNDDDVLQPNNGCPIESIEIEKDIQLITIDTQWYIENWDDYPKMNDKCDIKTRTKFFIAIEDELKGNADKTIILAMSHPLITNGEFGGKYPLFDPKLANNIMRQVKIQGAISKQDRYNERYNELMDRIKVMTKDSKRLVMVSGHDNSLQYSEQGSTRQVISGSASTATAAALGQFGEFSYGGQGFSTLQIFKDGSTVVTFYKANGDGTSESIFQKRIIPAEKKMTDADFPDSYPGTVQSQVYEDSQVDKTGFYKTVWGQHYRNVYNTKVNAKVALLDTLYGGLKVVRPGGGHQTRSLRLEDKDGKPYNMRALKKSAVQFLQNVLIKNKLVEEDFKNTLPEDLILDFYTAAHPYGAFTIADLADAAEIFHTNPKLFFVPKQEALGKYNDDYGDELYMIVEKPDKAFDGAIFDNADDNEGTDDLLAKLRKDEKYQLDEPTYIRARVFDMLVGDWDRHADQWRWAQYDKDNVKLFKPIPRDRDQVFSNFDGGLLDVVRTLFNTSQQFQVYGKDLKHTAWFNSAGIKLDRSIIENYGREEWIKQAEFIKQNVTDAVIEKAFNELPKEVLDETALDIKEKLKGRRENIVRIAGEYYDYLAKLQTITGTDKDDYFEITRMPEGKTNVKTYRIKNGDKGKLMVDRTFDGKETKEIWLYGLDDDDVFEVKGKGSSPIFIRIIGGQNNDTYKISNGRKIKVYDQKNAENTIEEKGGAAFRLTDNYNFNTYNYLKEKKNINLFLPSIGFNPDDGLAIGISDMYTMNGFQQNPFAQQHRIQAGYYFETQSFNVNYEGEFANIFGNYNFIVGGYFKNPNFSENFFGFGNETVNPEYENDDLFDMDYNRTRTGGYGAHIGLKKDTHYGSTFQYNAKFDAIKVEDTEGRFISLANPIELDKTKYFISAEGIYEYESYDNKINPSRGMNFGLTVGGTQNIEDSDAIFGYVKPNIIFYNALTKNRKLVLKTDVRGQFNIGNNFEFYQGAKLGGDTGLRGYRNERFIGRSSAVAGADLRYSFNKFRTGVTPLQIGIFGGSDVGRVWVSNDTSDKLHSSYGGGFWINAADLVGGTLNVFSGDEGVRLSFGLSLSM